jgi:CubicO group peptidase (beta-lactamase class C family)
MRIWGRAAALALVSIALWTGIVLGVALRGWGREAIAPSGDAAAFLEAASHRLDDAHAGNAVLLLLEGGQVVGEHDVSVGEPVGPDTVFQVASLSKWITAFGVMTLVEDGRLALDAPVDGYLTRWHLPPSSFDNEGVTLRRLLSHTAGLTDGLGYQGFEPGETPQTLEESLTHASDAMPRASGVARVGAEPGTEWRYSGASYTLLQLLIEEVTGESFDAYMQRAVLAPLGMTQSSFHWSPESGAVLATFYDVDSEPAPHYRFTALGAASLYTTAEDLARFLQAQRPGPHGEPPGRGVLAPETLEQMREPQAHQLGLAIWGLGTILYAKSASGGYVIGHDGMNAPAINTTARLDPATGDGIVVLETGNPQLATAIGGEWVFWKTGRPDLTTIATGLEATLRTLLGGIAAILALSGLLAWRLQRQARAA